MFVWHGHGHGTVTNPDMLHATILPGHESRRYAPALERRKLTEEWSDANIIVCLDAIKEMRASVNMPWRQFTRLLTLVGREPDL